MASDQLTVSGVFCSPRIVKSWGEEHNFVISQVEEEPPALCLTGQACEGWHLTNLRLVQKSASRWKQNWEESDLVRKASWHGGLDSTDLNVQLPGAWSAVSGGRWAHLVYIGPPSSNWACAHTVSPESVLHRTRRRTPELGHGKVRLRKEMGLGSDQLLKCFCIFTNLKLNLLMHDVALL